MSISKESTCTEAVASQTFLDRGLSTTPLPQDDSAPETNHSLRSLDTKTRVLDGSVPPNTTGNSPLQPDPEEVALAERVVGLWTKHTQNTSAIRRTRAAQAALRAALGEDLYNLKQRYCRPGRDGEWSSFLKKAAIPRSSADRHATRHEKLLAAPSSCPTGASTDAEKVTMLVKSLTSKLAKLLPTSALIQQFWSEITVVTDKIQDGLKPTSTLLET